MSDHICSECEEEFKTQDENYLARNDVCADCFEFPDVHYDETPADDYSVFLVASVAAGMHGMFHAAYFRVGAKTAEDARFFARAYELLEDTVNNDRSSLTGIEFDGEKLVEHRIGAPITEFRVMELPIVERHDGYAVIKLGTRNGDDYGSQKYGPGPTTFDLLPDPNMEYKDVLVHATPEQIDHKHRDTVPEDHDRCWWSVSGTPRETRALQQIWFEVGGWIVATGQILDVENGRIWFTPLEDVEIEPPKEPPNQGFTYIDPIDTGTDEKGALVVEDE